MNNDVKKDKRAPKRKRRTAELARREILDAAKKRLMDKGPEGLRLKVIAEDVGISHSSIIHHFGSRDGLLSELRDDAFDGLARDLKKRLAEPSQGDPSVDFFEKISSTLGEQGYGRLLAWQMMSGNLPIRASVGMTVLGPDGSGGLLDGLSRRLHTMRIERARSHGEPIPELDETRTIVAMCACTVLGEAIAGDVMVRSAGLGRTPEDRKGFRAWFAKQAERTIYSRTASVSRLEPQKRESNSADEDEINEVG
jgi:AcrR family transcriptional regulator